MLTIKSLHIIFIVTWFAAIFYLPRLFVYHAMTDEEKVREQLKIMERKLYWGIATPSAVLTVIFGLWLSFLLPTFFLQYWYWGKFALVILLIAYQLYCHFLMLKLRENPRYRSHVWFRWFNELPVIILVAIIFLVEFKPF